MTSSVACPGPQESMGPHRGPDGQRWDAMGVGSNLSARPTAESRWAADQVSFRGGTPLCSHDDHADQCAGNAARRSCTSGRPTLAAEIARLSFRSLEFQNWGAATPWLGIPFFVPPLAEGSRWLRHQVATRHNLKAIQGALEDRSVFPWTNADGNVSHVEKHFDMIHVVRRRPATMSFAQVRFAKKTRRLIGGRIPPTCAMFAIRISRPSERAASTPTPDCGGRSA